MKEPLSSNNFVCDTEKKKFPTFFSFSHKTYDKFHCEHEFIVTIPNKNYHDEKGNIVKVGEMKLQQWNKQKSN